MRTQVSALLAAILTLTAQLPSAIGAECVGQHFADNVNVGTSSLLLNGMGIRKATIFNVHVYVAGLYLAKKSSDAGAILSSNEPWRLVLRFVHDADASDIRDAFEDGFNKGASDNIGALRTRVDALRAQMVDFKTGYALSYTYDPATGTVVDVNGKAGPPITGADFATALLKISIGPEPPNDDLKTGLLGGACG